MTSPAECSVGARHEAEIRNLERSDGEQWTAIGEARDRYEAALREIASRMPNWGVAVMAVGSGVGGAIIGVLGTLLALQGKT